MVKIDFTEEELSYMEGMISCNYGDDEVQPEAEKKSMNSVLNKIQGARK